MKIGGIEKFSTVDYPGHTSAAIFTIGCNMRCGYCHNPELVLPEQYLDSLPVDEIVRFLHTRIGLLDGVTISGGEPTIHNDLPEFVRMVKNMSYLVKLDTNGTHPRMLEQMLDDNLLDFVAMDIKGPLDMYQQIAARPVDEAAIRDSIRLIKTRVAHEFRTTIVRGQLVPEDFDAIGQLVAGAERYALQYYRKGQTVSPQFQEAEGVSDHAMQQCCAIMSRYVKDVVVH